MLTEKQKEYWLSLEKFIKEEDIPNLPIVDKEEWNNFIVPILIKCGAIPKKDLVIGSMYIGSCRNTNNAVWNGDKFIYERYKFGMKYFDNINHFEDDNGFDLFVPIKKI
jgi:hypothetical protein